jgi:hypothetical protein
MSEMRIKSLNTSPFEHLQKLVMLDLSKNQITRMNLDSLSVCSLLTHLDLRDNKIKSLDISPLFACLRLSRLAVDDSVDLSASSDLKDGVIPLGIAKIFDRILWK